MLTLAARHGPTTLIAGLVAGFALPEIASALRPFLPHMVGMLLFLAAVQIAPRDILGSLKTAPSTLLQIAGLQLLWPLVAIAIGSVLGVIDTPAFLALMIMSCAPSIAGSPNMMIMMGGEPAHALRLLVIGTAFAPLTVLLIFPLVTIFGPPGQIVITALWLASIIFAATFAAMLVRHFVLPDPAEATRLRLRGASNIMLAVFVVGLMEPLRDLTITNPVGALAWFTFAMAACFGFQLIGWLAAARLSHATRAAIAIVAGNRNFALYFIALAPEITAPVLAFLACYQIPMYLTPILMRRVYAGKSSN